MHEHEAATAATAATTATAAIVVVVSSSSSAKNLDMDDADDDVSMSDVQKNSKSLMPKSESKSGTNSGSKAHNAKTDDSKSGSKALVRTIQLRPDLDDDDETESDEEDTKGNNVKTGDPKSGGNKAPPVRMIQLRPNLDDDDETESDEDDKKDLDRNKSTGELLLPIMPKDQKRTASQDITKGPAKKQRPGSKTMPEKSEETILYNSDELAADYPLEPLPTSNSGRPLPSSTLVSSRSSRHASIKKSTEQDDDDSDEDKEP